MSEQRILIVGLDGYDPVIARGFMAQGLMPNFHRLMKSCAEFPLDHGVHRLTGLSWEHFATGRTPQALERWSAVNFDRRTYRVHQATTTAPPFLAPLGEKLAVFDAPYFDLTRAPGALGLVNWGSHDPGVPPFSRPAGLKAEIESRFGPYPGYDYIYGFLWPDPARIRASTEALVAALRKRSEISQWLFGERLPDWQVAVVVVSELHSSIEQMWHGVDANSPLHGRHGTNEAREGIKQVYEALDDMIGDFEKRFPDAMLVLFCMHGMGQNNADVASMLLLPEFCYRRTFGREYFVPRGDWLRALNARITPPLRVHENWERAVGKRLGGRWPNRMKTWLSSKAQGFSGTDQIKPENDAGHHDGDVTNEEFRSETNLDLGWMPATQYRQFWPDMDCFAMPSFYDGRVRVNLAGRESRGRVSLADYFNFCDGLETDLKRCVDPVSGDAAIEAIYRPSRKNPMELGPTESDLQILWSKRPNVALHHESYGLIGPAPVRRPGGHTGGDGVAYFARSPIASGVHAKRSAFDIAPTIAHLLGMPDVAALSGTSIIASSYVARH